MADVIESPLSAGCKLEGGKYTIVKSLGQGGFGITYLATTPVELKGELGNITESVNVVVKEFFMKGCCGRATDGTTMTVVSESNADMVNRYREKFKKEAMQLASMRHPNIVGVTDVVKKDNDTIYYVMRFLSGGTLQKLVKPVKEKPGVPLLEECAMKYVRQIASALSYMHSRNMCHFDVKPGNIMLDNQDNAVLIDFGLAKNYSKNGEQTSSILMGASVGYSPLEQNSANLETFSPQTDIYALGATLYFLLTGHTPQAASFNQQEVLPWGQCGMSDKTWKAIQCAMQPSPYNRPKTISEFINMIDGDESSGRDTSGGSTVSSKPASDNDETRVIGAKRNSKTLPWKKIGIYGAAAVAGLLIVLAASSLFSSKDSSKEEKGTVTAEATTELSDNSLFSGAEEEVKENTEKNGLFKYADDDAQQRATFEGRYTDNERIEGTLTWKNGDKYVGTFENDNFAKGKLVLSDGTYFEGDFKNNQPYNGKWYKKDGTAYITIKDGKQNK